MPYASPKRTIAICNRSGQQMLRKDMVEDGYLRGMLVHPEWYDPIEPQEEPFDPEEGIAIYKPAPDLVAPYPPYSAVLAGGPVGADFVMSWTQQDVPWGTLNNWTVWRKNPGSTFIKIATLLPVIPVDFFIQTTDQIKGDPLSVVTGLAYTDLGYPNGAQYYVVGNFVGANISEDAGFVSSAPSNTLTAPVLWTSETSANFVTLNFGTDGTNLIGVGSDAFSAGQAQYSPDGVNWTIAAGTIPNGATPNAAAFGGGNAVIAGGTGEASISTDLGATFAAVTTNIPSSGVTAVAYGGGFWVMGGGPGEMSTSPDGTNWTRRTLSTASIGCLDIIWDGTQFVAGFYDTVGTLSYISTSPTGVTWTHTLMNSDHSFVIRANGLAFTGSKYIALGVTNASPVLRSSATLAGLGSATNVAFSFNAQAMAYGNGLTVVVGATGNIVTSPDLVTWTPEVSGVTATLSTAIYCPGNSIFVASSQGTAHILIIRTGS